MLRSARLYMSELKHLYELTAFDPKYTYYHGSYFKEMSFPEDTWNKHQFVSVNKENEVIGYIEYTINQRSYNASNLCIAHFTDTDNIEFARDIFKAIDDMFCTFKFNKLTHSVFIGNPVEKTYDRLHKRYGGRIVGTFKKEVKLMMTGEVVDEKVYEILREDYLKKKGSRI